MLARVAILYALPLVFHRHLHTTDCLICNGVPSTPASPHAEDVARRTTPPASRGGHPPPTDPRVTGTRTEWMEEAMHTWMQTYSEAALRRSCPVRTPTILPIPAGDDLLLPALTYGAGVSNAFLGDKLLSVECAALGDGGVAKQLLFQQTLLDFQAVMHTFAPPAQFFLACGTALGAHREGYFIPHDDDIDVGIFLEDLAALGEKEEAPVETDDPALLLAGSGLRRILSSLTTGTSDGSASGHFVIFDVCGSVGKGLEVRLLHLRTNVRVDFNVYYTATEPAVNAGDPFVWSATYYEEAHQRAHGMYRYQHAPFRHTLQRVPFCTRSRAEDSTFFLVPPVSYLEEYFGPDWRTPKQYSYADGLKGEYKNIIQE